MTILDKETVLFEETIHPFLFEGVNEDIIELFRKFANIQKVQLGIISLIAKRYNIYHGQLLCLKVIDSRPYISQSDLAKKLNLKRATITAHLKRLEKQQLIKRLEDENDQRILRIILTNKGKKIVTSTNKIMADQLNEWYKKLDIAEVDVLLTASDKVLESVLANYGSLQNGSGELAYEM